MTVWKLVSGIVILALSTNSQTVTHVFFNTFFFSSYIGLSDFSYNTPLIATPCLWRHW